MKTILIFGLIVILVSIGFSQITLAIETKQEPQPPQIPEPSPSPEPIQTPTPAPTPDPFPEGSDIEKIEQLTNENNSLKNQIAILKNENSKQQSEIYELNDVVKNLKEITMEQIRVIQELANNLKDVLFEKIFFSRFHL